MDADAGLEGLPESDQSTLKAAGIFTLRAVLETPYVELEALPDAAGILHRVMLRARDASLGDGLGDSSDALGVLSPIPVQPSVRYRHVSSRLLEAALFMDEPHDHPWGRMHDSVRHPRSGGEKGPFGGGTVGAFESRKNEREVRYESEGELRVLLMLEASPGVKYYVPQPFVVEGVIDGRQWEYVPDVLVATTEDFGIAIEVEPIGRMIWDQASRQRALLAAACQREEYGWLFTDGLRTERGLMSSHPVEAGIEQYLVDAAESVRGLEWPHVKGLRKRGVLSSADLAAVALRHDLVLVDHEYPMRRRPVGDVKWLRVTATPPPPYLNR